MKAIYYHSPGRITVEDVEKPRMEAGGLLLKVKAAAICGTDLRIYKNGHFKIKAGEKRVLGHEVAGEIVGSGASAYPVGVRVAIAPNIGCGVCPMCIAGQNQLCPDYEAFGISLDGGFQEYMSVPESAVARGNVAILPQAMSYAEAVLAEPLSCTYNAYESVNTRPGDTVLIIGAGPIGSCHVMLQRLAGAGKIIVADILENRLAEIKKFGADITVNSADTDLVEAVKKHTHGRGADVVITANSVPELQALALELAAARGRINLFGGMPKGRELVELNTNLIHYKELVITATTGSSIEDHRQAINIAASGRIPLNKISVERFSLEDAQAAFDFALSGAGMKVMFSQE